MQIFSPPYGFPVRGLFLQRDIYGLFTDFLNIIQG